MQTLVMNIRPRVRIEMVKTGSYVIVPGTDVIKGDDGNSAYQIAVLHGFSGTEEEWLISLQGLPVLSGEKLTGRDAGKFGQRSLTDDYEYTCVQEGDETNAIWKSKSLIAT
jgi:hypothetical protein